MSRLERLPAIAAAAAIAATALAAGSVTAGTARGATATGATVTGTVRQPGTAAGLEGMSVELIDGGCASATAAGCTTTAVTGAGGRFTITGLAAGSYDVDVLDGTATDQLTSVTVSGEGEQALTLTLPAPSVPAGAVARNAQRDLRRLDAERVANGLPGDVTLNPRWSAECAAHDAYEQAAGVLSSSEDPTATDASAGGAWAGLHADLAQGTWTAGASPWQTAPIHLLALMAPSLSVTGIDDSNGYQCAITWPGMVRPAVSSDTVSTYPGPGATGVPASESASETPYTPTQFIGLAAQATTGPELLVYLNRSGVAGQAPVTIVSASLRQDGHSVDVRWVDSSTATLAPYLAGAIVIPTSPLEAHTGYRASVTVRDGARTLTHRWRFTTG